MILFLLRGPPPENIGGGIYAIIIATHPARVVVGSLGEVEFKHGYALYIGSAQRSLRGRLRRHFEGGRRVRWHIDYLLQVFTPVSAIALPGARKSCEEELAIRLSQRFPYVKGFGSSDDSSPSHLFLSADYRELFQELIRASLTLCESR